MINAQVELVILSLNKISLEYEILSLDKYNLSTPKVEIVPESDIESMLNRLIESYINISSSYIKPKLYNVDIFNSKLTISYFYIMPFGVSTKNSFFLPIKEYINYQTNFSKIIQYF